MPLWTHIEVLNIIPPLLHLFLGITNDVFDKFIYFWNVRILQLNDEQLKLLLDIEVTSDILQKVIENEKSGLMQIVRFSICGSLTE